MKTLYAVYLKYECVVKNKSWPIIKVGHGCKT